MPSIGANSADFRGAGSAVDDHDLAGSAPGAAPIGWFGVNGDQPVDATSLESDLPAINPNAFVWSLGPGGF